MFDVNAFFFTTFLEGKFFRFDLEKFEQRDFEQIIEGGSHCVCSDGRQGFYLSNRTGTFSGSAVRRRKSATSCRLGTGKYLHRVLNVSVAGGRCRWCFRRCCRPGFAGCLRWSYSFMHSTDTTCIHSRGDFRAGHRAVGVWETAQLPEEFSAAAAFADQGGDVPSVPGVPAQCG